MFLSFLAVSFQLFCRQTAQREWDESETKLCLPAMSFIHFTRGLHR